MIRATLDLIRAIKANKLLVDESLIIAWFAVPFVGELVKYSIRFNHVEGYLAALPNTRTVKIVSVKVYAGAGYEAISRQLKIKCLEDLQAQGYTARIT